MMSYTVKLTFKFCIFERLMADIRNHDELMSRVGSFIAATTMQSIWPENIEITKS